MPRTSVRRTKIVATLGPAWDQPEQDGHAARRRCQRRPHQRLARHRRDPRPLGRAAPRGHARPARLGGGAAGSPGPAHPDRHASRSRSSSSTGETVTFAPEEEAAAREIPTTYEGLAADVRVGARILLDDGLLALEVTGHPRPAGSTPWCTTAASSRSHKGMNLPGIEVSAPALTEKDLEDVAQAVAVGRRLRGAFVRAPARGHGAAPDARPPVDQAGGQDREGHRPPEPLRHPRRVRRDHGRPGRPRRRAAVRGSAADAEADHPRGRSPREAGHHRHPDARVDDPRAASHPRGGLGRGQRHPRRHRRRHAVGRDGRGGVPAGGGAGDGPDRAGDGAAAGGPRRDHRCRARAPRGRRRQSAAAPGRAKRAGPDRGRHRRRGVRRGGDAERAAHRLLHQQRVHRAQGRDLPADRADLRLARPSRTRSASSHWCGA